MANGFAMRGFTQGFTQGLQNVNDLYNSYVERDLRRAESERLHGAQDIANRKSEMQLEAGSLELAKAKREEEQAKKQGDYPRIYGILNKGGDFSDEDVKALHDYGLGSMLSGEDDSENLMRLANDVRSGRRGIEDPEVSSRLLPALQPMMNRDIGGVGRDPRTGQPVRIAAKVPTGFRNINGKVVPMLSVRGADKDGQYVEYDAPATQFGSSVPEDPLLALSNERAAQKLEGAARLNRQVAQNPELRTRLQEYAGILANGAPKAISAKDQAYILDKTSQINSRQINDEIKSKELEINSKTGQAKVEAEKELANLRREKSITEQSIQDKNSGLGSAGRTKAATFNRDRAKKRAGDIYRAPPKAMDGITDSPEVERERQTAAIRQNQFVDTVESLVTKRGLPQDQAEMAAREGQPIKNVKAPDGRVFNGWRAQIDGKWVNIPFEWVN